MLQESERDSTWLPAVSRTRRQIAEGWDAEHSWSPELEERWLEREEPCLREIVRNFERCEARFPKSPLTPDARLAAAYWRRIRPALFSD